ncbi:MAG: energy transducer TonB [Kofleriaceae bacterium]
MIAALGRGALVLAAVGLGCGGAGVASTPRRLHPLPEPPLGDPAALGRGYLEQVYQRVRPHWRQFLDDCRRRLPPSHPLNDRHLEATASLRVDADGVIVDAALASSGQAAFDAAVRELLADVAPLPAPPVTLRSDDELTHLRWLFARDHRAAGPGTAEVVLDRWPAVRAVPALLARGELVEAAARVLAEAPGPEGTRLSREVLGAIALAEAADGQGLARERAVAALAAVEAPAAIELVRELVATATPVPGQASASGEPALALAAAAAVAERDPALAAATAQAVLAAATARPTLAQAAAELLGRLGRADDAIRTVTPWLAGGGDLARTGWQVLAIGDGPLTPALATSLRAALAAAGDDELRRAACAAAHRAPVAATRRALVAAARARELATRRACVRALGTFVDDAAVARSLARALDDRDDELRAAAVVALARLGPASRHAPRLGELGGRAALERAAVAEATASWRTDDELDAWLGDDSPAVRAAAAAELVRRGAGAGALVRLAADPSVEVRRVVASLGGALLDDPVVEVRQAAWEASARADLATAARAALARLASATSDERVRLAVAVLAPAAP